MPNKYFKPHEPFDLNPHRYDIGIFTGLKNGFEDNLFIKKLFTLLDLEYSAYYGSMPNVVEQGHFLLFLCIKLR